MVTIQLFFAFIIAYGCGLGFEKFSFAYVQTSEEMVEKGRSQYQLLQERGSLPQYGPCWKGAVEHVENGCRFLSEESQSDMALHITNCFLEMSGHETYNCELNKKANLKAICINSMSDRAFNIYTEFYIHVNHICWFLQGQVWQETIIENTFKVAKYQHEILQNQKNTLELQEKLSKYGESLGRVMDEFYMSTKAHQEILKLMTDSVSRLQSWLIGEISWFDTIIYYVFFIVFNMFLTGSSRTQSARLPIFCLLLANLFVERYMTHRLSNMQLFYSEVNEIQEKIYYYVWICRYFFSFCAIFTLIYKTIFYKDINYECYLLLQDIKQKLDEDKSSKTGKSIAKANKIIKPVVFISENKPISTYNLRARVETPEKMFP